jgi:hypothetical protein
MVAPRQREANEWLVLSMIGAGSVLHVDRYHCTSAHRFWFCLNSPAIPRTRLSV